MIIDNHKNFRDRLSIDYQYQSINWYRLSSIVIDCHRLSISLIVQVLKLKDSGFLETLKYLFAWLKLVVSLNVLPNYISDLLFIVSCLLQFSLLCRLFSIIHEHRLQEYCRAYQTLFKITHRHKTINKK